MFEDQIDDIVTKTLKLGVQDLLKLAMKGMGTYTIRSHWPCITPGADSGLKLVAALPDGVFSDKFKCLAKIACKFEQGDYKKHDQFVSSIPTFEKICGTEVTKAVQKAIDELVTVRDEIEALFKNYPSVEWLLPLVTKGHTINSRKNGQDCTMNFETTLSDYLKTAAPTNPAFKA